MQSTWVWPRRHTELEFVGTVPWTLDGLFVLPERALGDAFPRLHGLRLHRGAPVWYAVLPEHGMAEVVPAPPRLVGRGEDPETLVWTLSDRDGHVRDSGRVQMEGAPDVVDLALTCQRVVLLSATKSVQTWDAPEPRYRVGIAVRHEHARATSYALDRRGRPSLLYAGDQGDLVVVDLAFCEVSGTQDARLSRLTIDTQTRLAHTRATFDRPLRFPTVHPPPGCDPCRFVYGVTSPRALHEGPSLVRLDPENGSSWTWSLAFARQLGPPTLVPLTTYSDRRSVLLAPVYDAVHDTSEVRIIDPECLNEEPLAIIRLPHPVHSEQPGIWLPTR